MQQPLVTILIPHYKTLELTQLCLRLIRKNTNLSQAKIIVIDNDSRDESTNYLRQLTGIELIERKSIKDEGAISAHARALDLGLQKVTTPYVLSIHTDTLIKDPEWLPFLLSAFHDANIAGVGSWKLECKNGWQKLLKRIERLSQQLMRYLVGKPNKKFIDKDYYYLRSHCALYQTALLKKLNLTFSMNNDVAGKGMHQALLEAGYQMIFIPSIILSQYMLHVNHATTVLNKDLSRAKRSITKGEKRIRKALLSLNAKQVLNDHSLDLID